MSKHLVNDMTKEGGGNYGDLFWKIGLPDGRQISIYADTFHVDDSGALIAEAHSGKDRQKKFPGLVLAAGQWEYVYSASVLDGSAVSIDYIDEKAPQS